MWPVHTLADNKYVFMVGHVKTTTIEICDASNLSTGLPDYSSGRLAHEISFAGIGTVSLHDAWTQVLSAFFGSLLSLLQFIFAPCSCCF